MAARYGHSPDTFRSYLRRHAPELLRKHWLAQPEARYWFCEAMSSHFLGLHALGGEYNVGHIDLPVDFLGSNLKKLKDYRYQGWFAGVGIAYGYSWLLAKYSNPSPSMKRYILIPTLLFAASAIGATRNTAVSSPALTKVEGLINVDMNLDLSAFDVKSNQLVVVTPYLVNGADILYMQSVGIYGRKRYIQHQHGVDNGAPVPHVLFKASQARADYHYYRMLPYAEWIDGATLSIRQERYGCAVCARHTLTASQIA